MTRASAGSGGRSRAVPRTTLGGVIGDPRAWSLRSVRAAVFAAASVGLAISAHRLAGGLPPRPLLVVAAAGILFLLGVAVSARERRLWHIAALVGASQVALHAALGTHPRRTTAQWSALLFCHDSAHGVSAAQVAAAREHFAAAPHSSGGLGMITAHVVAAAAMAWWLRRGERAAWRVVQRVVSHLLGCVVAPTWVASVQRAMADVWAPVPRVWGTGLAGRGPPRWAASVLPTA